ncbi:MAG TPA: MBL fold metallo-hydrolase [Thermodesulfobacteriota bacterium]
MGDRHRLQLPDGEPPETGRGSVFFVGTATVLIRCAGFTVLTDPNFLHAGDHVHLGYGLVARRLTDPALEIEDLPPIDLVVLSHLHGDHFDRIAEARLDRQVPILTTPEAAAYLSRRGFRRALPLRRWESACVARGPATLRVTALPGRHGPPLVSRLLPEVMGSLLDFQDVAGLRRLRLYISGDTLVHDDLYEIPRRVPGIDLALLHLGGTRVLGVLVTMDDGQGVEAVRIVRPEVAIPIHYDDYTVFKSPLVDFLRAAEAAGLRDRVVVLRRGETFAFEVPRAAACRAARTPHAASRGSALPLVAARRMGLPLALAGAVLAGASVAAAARRRIGATAHRG